MDNPEKLATHGTQNEKKNKAKTQHNICWSPLYVNKHMIPPTNKHKQRKQGMIPPTINELNLSLFFCIYEWLPYNHILLLYADFGKESK
jgi:hypothetical protein